MSIYGVRVNSLLNDKTLAWSKLKAFADDKLDVVKMMISLFESLENTVEKGENAGYQFSKAFIHRVVKSGDCVITHSHTITPFDAPG